MKIYGLTIAMSLFLLAGCGQSDESEIRSICDTFLEGRVQMYQTGDLTLLDKACNDKLDSLNFYYNEEMKLLFSEGYSKSSFIQSSMAESVQEVVIMGDSARCKMRELSLYELNLIKSNGKWLVHGMNGEFATSELIAERKEKLAKRQEENENIIKSKPVLAKIEAFKGKMDKMFRDRDFSELQGICSTEVIDFMKLFVDHCLQQETLESIQTKRNSFKTWVGYTSFTDSTVTCVFNQEASRTYNLVIDNSGEWKIIGFNNIIGDQLNRESLIDHYQSFMRAFGIYGDKRI